ncbi:MAG: hypothetical protein FWG70_02235 [Oscillospiraceae bacterium]|nr:hypothetical protein [Oscillospiraceae bacterium]
MNIIKIKPENITFKKRIKLILIFLIILTLFIFSPYILKAPVLIKDFFHNSKLRDIGIYHIAVTGGSYSQYGSSSGARMEKRTSFYIFYDDVKTIEEFIDKVEKLLLDKNELDFIKNFSNRGNELKNDEWRYNLNFKNPDKDFPVGFNSIGWFPKNVIHSEGYLYGSIGWVEIEYNNSNDSPYTVTYILNGINGIQEVEILQYKELNRK